MMANLFSSFDPSTTFNTSLNWASSFLGLLILPSFYWFIPSRYNMFWNKIMMMMYKEFSILLKSSSTKGASIIMVSLFMFIVFNNFIGLFPYIFTSTSHMILTLTLSLPLWATFMIYGWMNHTTHMLAHLVPQGAPAILLPFLVIIETISNVIRPGTLAIRLSANMIAGHLLVTLMGNSGPAMSSTILMILIFSQILLLTLESAVAVIQGYVFSMLTTLYSSEIN
uniref:ATP synthase subunit a n=1 Tax=Rhinostomus barbirostris TaxID=206507 RepID=A0A346RIC7_9CUCU|nr:ATP synthase F0 subunit 6 [Rhinostomus barbirostris]